MSLIPLTSVSPAVRAPLLGRPHVLVAEDDVDLAYGLELSLASSYDVTSTQSAREALQSCEADRPDVVILDYQLPDQNGIRLFETLRRRFGVVPAIMLSAYSNRRASCLEAGFVDFLEKPYDPETLVNAIERALVQV